MDIPKLRYQLDSFLPTLEGKYPKANYRGALEHNIMEELNRRLQNDIIGWCKTRSLEELLYMVMNGLDFVTPVPEVVKEPVVEEVILPTLENDKPKEIKAPKRSGRKARSN
jgi:hypothetical protein